MRCSLVAALTLAASVAWPAGTLSAQQHCGSPESPAQLAGDALTRLVGNAPIDSTRRVRAIEAIERALHDTQLTRSVAATPGTRPTVSETQARMKRLYVELEELLRPDVDLRHLTRADAPPRYLVIRVACDVL